MPPLALPALPMHTVLIRLDALLHVRVLNMASRALRERPSHSTSTSSLDKHVLVEILIQVR